MNDKEPPKNFLDKIYTYATIILGTLSGVAFCFCLVCAVNHDWIEFAICLAIAVVLLIVMIPLSFKDDIYECPKCGHKFKVNPYKIFFSKGILSDLEGEPTKYVKLKCPHCKIKDYCKRNWKKR